MLTEAKPLDDARYMRAHLAFRERSTQRTLMLDWLAAEIAAARPAGAPLRLLSVGSGAGVLDAPLVARLQAGGPVDFVGVDPNLEENAVCRARMAEALAPGSRARIVDGVIEEFETDARFDAVIAVHCFYYSADIRRALERTVSLIAPGGALFALVAPDNALSEFFRKATLRLKGFEPCLSGALSAQLAALGLEVARATLDARVDLTAMAADEEPAASLLTDFIIHADLSACAPEVRAALRAEILSFSYRARGRTFVPHPVDALIAQRPGAG